MTYEETVQYLFESAPLFQNLGGSAYKEGLANTLALDKHFDYPHRRYKTIHVAGTNGKGSCSHSLAAILQCAGWRVGLYTSPHLVDFRERIRVNGEAIPEDYVVDFVARERDFFEPLHPSFFELTTALAFKYFADEQVDVAIIEVGLGGRLDCTNIIKPELCVITNISLDHTQFLGTTLADIAAEKAGIIKAGVPVVVGEALPETRPVFEERAKSVAAPLTFAEDVPEVLSSSLESDCRCYETRTYGELRGELRGDCQHKNTNTLLCALARLREEWHISEADVRRGLCNVCSLTELMGRWQQIGERPTVICDTGHNLAGWELLSRQLAGLSCRHLHVVFGMVDDKDITGVLRLLPQNAIYYYTQASVKRAMTAEKIRVLALENGLPEGVAYHSVAEAYEAALAAASEEDAVFVGGSSFVVADFLTWLGRC